MMNIRSYHVARCRCIPLRTFWSGQHQSFTNYDSSQLRRTYRDLNNQLVRLEQDLHMLDSVDPFSRFDLMENYMEINDEIRQLETQLEQIFHLLNTKSFPKD
jgi:cell shape-determining protein MreC